MPRTVFWCLRATPAFSLLAVLVPLLLSQPPAAGKRYALVVGINEYEHGDLTP
jgi:hypothetical protein